MPPDITPRPWVAAPERSFRDVVSSSAQLDADDLRAVFERVGMAALDPDTRPGLVLPPLKTPLPPGANACGALNHNAYVEIGLVTRGEMTLWWEGTASRCPAGALFVIPPGTLYMPHARPPGEPARDHSVVWLALHRGSVMVHQCRLEGSQHHLSEYYCFADTQVLSQARNIAQELADRQPFFVSAVRGNLLCLLAGLLRAPVIQVSRFNIPREEENAADPDLFSQRVDAYLLSCYHRPITLAQIARSIGCSPAYLCRHYRALTGRTPFQFLRSVRLESAKHLLFSDVPIARVAEMVGFDDALYFSKVFSAHMGESPMSYRTRARAAARSLTDDTP